MSLTSTIDDLLVASAASPALQAATIIVGTFILEDAASILAALAAASGLVPAGLALGALFLGIAIGDLGLYGLGRLAATHPWAWRIVKRRARRRAQEWLKERLVVAVISSRFVPGMRLPTYTACGFLRVSLLRFTAAVVGATLVWTSLVFWAVYRLGPYAGAELGFWRWPLGVAIALLPLAWTRLFRREAA